MGGHGEECIGAADSEGGSVLSVASNADTDSEEEDLSHCSSESCSGTPPTVRGEFNIFQKENQNHVKISKNSQHNPSEILNLILKEAESSETVWTNDQHCSYLNSMEAAFVRNMFGKAYYAAEHYRARAQQRSSTSSPYARKVLLSPGRERQHFRSSVMSHTDNANFSFKIRKGLDPSINAEHANCLDCQQDSQKRQLIRLEVPELESCVGQYAFPNQQSSSGNGISEKTWPDASQEKHKSYMYQKQFQQHASMLQNSQHDTGHDKKVDLDQVVPSTHKPNTRLILDEPSAVAATKSGVEFKESSNKCQVPGI